MKNQILCSSQKEQSLSVDFLVFDFFLYFRIIRKKEMYQVLIFLF